MKETKDTTIQLRADLMNGADFRKGSRFQQRHQINAGDQINGKGPNSQKRANSDKRDQNGKKDSTRNTKLAKPSIFEIFKNGPPDSHLITPSKRAATKYMPPWYQMAYHRRHMGFSCFDPELGRI